jgi:UTP--glucose-1-phosphate uridylyltransferase
LIITGRNKRAIEDHFDKSVELEIELEKKNDRELLKTVRDISDMVDIHYIRQKEAKGLGHAIYCAKTFVGNEPFAVLLGDDVVYTEGTPCLKQMIDVFDKYDASVLGVQTVKDEDICKYGIVEGNTVSDRIYKVNGLVEKPSIDEAPSNVAILGRYIITPGIFDVLAETKPGKGGEIQLTDALKVLAMREKMYAYDFIGKRYDVGNRMGFLEATVETALRREDLREEFLKYLRSVV